MMAGIRTKKFGVDAYWYFRRKNIKLDTLRKINGKTWIEAAKILGVQSQAYSSFSDMQKGWLN